ncbi:unnamed protein product [Ectocarpus sp. CCAP 1310/34]|nr:unnamed protein product [Ectocarpus sp. CCAP 1310/34]
MFISFTIHFVDGETLRTIDLACRPFNVTHSGENIAKELKSILTDAGLDPKKCTGITMDNASNMIRAGNQLDASDDSNILRLSCFCHSIQLSIQRFLGLQKVKGSSGNGNGSGSGNGSGDGGSGSGSGSSSGGGAPAGINAGPAAGGGGAPPGTNAGGAAGAGGGTSAGGGGGGSGPDVFKSGVKDTLQRCNAIVSKFNKSPKSTQLLKETADWLKVEYVVLQKHVETRWWSEVTTIRSVLTNKKALQALAMKNESPCPELLAGLDWDLLEILLQLLEPFAAVTAGMEADKYVTVGSVLGMVAFLQHKIGKLTAHANPGIAAPARDMKTDFDSRFKLDPFDHEPGTSGCTKLHLAAAFLDPRAKDFARIPFSIQQKAANIIECLGEQLIAEKLQTEFGADDAADDSASSGEDTQDVVGGNDLEAAAPKPKKNIFAQVWQLDDGEEYIDEELLDEQVGMAWGNYDHPPEPCTPRSRRKEEYDAQMKSEVLRYRGVTSMNPDGNPLTWWDQHKATFPLLRELSHRILCVPASSAASERLFSKAGLTLTKQRSLLAGNRVAQLVTLRGAVAAGVLDKY